MATLETELRTVRSDNLTDTEKLRLARAALVDIFNGLGSRRETDRHVQIARRALDAIGWRG